MERDAALRELVAGGCVTEVTSPVWIAKARCGEDVVDIIFSSGNGVAVVDDDWFAHAREATILDMRARLCPPEEMIWSKGYIMERERFDGADVAHLLRACGRTLDWPRLLARFDRHWPVLLVHLVLFAFVYPSERNAVPAWVMDELLAREARERAAAPSRERVCRGTLLSRYPVPDRPGPLGLPRRPSSAERTADAPAGAGARPRAARRLTISAAGRGSAAR